MPIDCGALVPTLIETELFGYVRGAFTGAAQTRQGLLSAARGGVVFLDEIGELPPDLQIKLLRALEEHEVRPVGGTEPQKFDARIVAATNRDLEAMVRQGTFRQDLYYRLNVLTVKLPPLRNRKGDIPLLVEYFLEKLSQGRRERPILSPKALELLQLYDWPGNVRELHNYLQRAVALTDRSILRITDFPEMVWNPRSEVLPSNGNETAVTPLQDLERQAIRHALRTAGGDKALAARMLGIGLTTLYRRLKQYQKEDKNGSRPL